MRCNVVYTAVIHFRHDPTMAHQKRTNFAVVSCNRNCVYLASASEVHLSIRSKLKSVLHTVNLINLPDCKKVGGVRYTSEVGISKEYFIRIRKSF